MRFVFQSVDPGRPMKQAVIRPKDLSNLYKVLARKLKARTWNLELRSSTRTTVTLVFNMGALVAKLLETKDIR